MKKKINKNCLFFAGFAVLLLLVGSVPASAYGVGVWVKVFNVNNGSNFYRGPDNFSGEPDVTVRLDYSNSGIPVNLTALTDSRGYSFNINDYPLGGIFYVYASKGDHSSSVVSRKFPEIAIDSSIQSQIGETLTISRNPIIVRVLSNRSIVNKGDPVMFTINVEFMSGELHGLGGMQAFPKFRRFSIADASKGDMFSKRTASYFFDGITYRNGYYLVDFVLGPYSYDENGTFATLNATSIKNGTDSLQLEDAILVDKFISSARALIITPTVSVTWPPDVNGDGNVTAADVGKINYCLQNKLTVAQCGEHTDANLDGNINITATDLGLVRANLGKQLVWEG